jgi:hypothetical protein
MEREKVGDERAKREIERVEDKRGGCERDGCERGAKKRREREISSVEGASGDVCIVDWKGERR